MGLHERADRHVELLVGCLILVEHGKGEGLIPFRVLKLVERLAKNELFQSDLLTRTGGHHRIAAERTQYLAPLHRDGDLHSVQTVPALTLEHDG